MLDGPSASQRRLLLRMAALGEAVSKRDLQTPQEFVTITGRQWDVLRLEQAGLIAADGADAYRITAAGRSAADFKPSLSVADLTDAWRALQAELKHRLLERIHAASPVFFENLILDLLVAMGYCGDRCELAQRLGRSRDGGIDGLVARDELGLDSVYMQAKRYAPDTAVPLADIRDFAGALDAKRASKGVFATSARFSATASEFCRQLSRRIALIDGVRLAELMIRYDLGVKRVETWQLKEIEPDYFATGS